MNYPMLIPPQPLVSSGNISNITISIQLLTHLEAGLIRSCIRSKRIRRLISLGKTRIIRLPWISFDARSQARMAGSSLGPGSQGSSASRLTLV